MTSANAENGYSWFLFARLSAASFSISESVLMFVQGSHAELFDSETLASPVFVVLELVSVSLSALCGASGMDSASGMNSTCGSADRGRANTACTSSSMLMMSNTIVGFECISGSSFATESLRKIKSVC